MEQAFFNFIESSTIFQKGVFLMIAGVCFVFFIQMIFYLIIKLWPKNKKAPNKVEQ